MPVQMIMLLHFFLMLTVMNSEMIVSEKVFQGLCLFNLTVYLVKCDIFNDYDPLLFLL